MRSNKRAFTLQTFKALKKPEDKITLLAITSKFILKCILTLKKTMMAEITLTFKRPLSGKSGQLEIGKLGFFYSRNIFCIVENKINE